ncbi:uncharacterized protein C8R40DRAFT_1266992 [Lentinula edodes]|uniref:uncharacterized protein n=1 Tax=Lentinula edodes TaxID=5353 RepID=UPI001E8D16D3|nr:uncharacterized protein C8R40DRAFT_1266992 [Lentinula edodes]KAH7872395.1 hypothetical protein C8R40DRAFT_1266992 [Lentinula edodes]
MKLAEQQMRLDKKFYNGHGLKKRPCIISGDTSKTFSRPGSKNTGLVPIVLMATFAGSSLNTLSSMHQCFSAPVLTTGQNQHFRDYFSYVHPFEQGLITEKRFISTIPEWKSNHRNAQQYIICYEYMVPTSQIKAWRCSSAAEYALDDDNQFKLTTLCKRKRQGWIRALKLHPQFYHNMVTDLLDFRHSSNCEEKHLFDSCTSYMNKGYQSRDNYKSSRVTVNEQAMSALYETDSPTNITPFQTTEGIMPPQLVSKSCLFTWSPEPDSTEYTELDWSPRNDSEQPELLLKPDYNSSRTFISNANLQLKQNNKSHIEISSRDSLISSNFRFPMDKSSSQISIERPPSERSYQSTWSVVSSKRGRKGRRMSGAGLNFTKRFGISKVQKD